MSLRYNIIIVFSISAHKYCDPVEPVLCFVWAAELGKKAEFFELVLVLKA